MERPRCSAAGCGNFAAGFWGDEGDGGLCKACRRGEGPDSAKRKREAELERAAEAEAARKKRAKLRDYREAQAPCVGCGGREMLSVEARSGQWNRYTLPSGEEREGCLPQLPGIADEVVGVVMKLCVDCGTIVGFDSAALKAAIARAEVIEE
ncbi:uncharacterized protein ACA1_055020 [Acanthamoeba castellanii str. Neff]|jgi:hypothetical protein|uniref:Uncharacterized protein n=1 Tax=Acanthamoeba castellanii (strain ATCC 30010 / Neff) TaxID=1257118 RepID=L8H8G7_ACACF|nr:uncharacterized protein ACA1_055020 [Acanthamoeba castellanii str. Neff]ELR20756.1 hypothetical protein ACA1_055020 [Acanthamoeba castellanii str. Neff]